MDFEIIASTVFDKTESPIFFLLCVLCSKRNLRLCSTLKVAGVKCRVTAVKRLPVLHSADYTFISFGIIEPVRVSLKNKYCLSRSWGGGGGSGGGGWGSWEGGEKGAGERVQPRKLSDFDFNLYQLSLLIYINCHQCKWGVYSLANYIVANAET